MTADAVTGAMERIYAIGDIHGCHDKLRRLMDRIDIDLENETLVFMGDYIDRGPEVPEVVSFLCELKRRYPRVVFLKGNHEQMLARYLTDFDKYTYLINGGRQTLESYMARNPATRHPATRNPATRHPASASPIPEEHAAFFDSLSLYHETEHYIFVHAGLRDRAPLSMQSPDDLLWIRSPFVESEYDFGKRVIFGHTPFTEPLVMPNKIGIDTGAVYGNKLTCVRLPDIVFFSE